CDMAVGSDQHAAALADFAQTRPVLIKVADVAAGPDDDARDLRADTLRDRPRRLRPSLAANAGEQCEAALADQVQRAHLMAVALQPAVRQPRPGPRRRAVVQLGIALVRRLGRSVVDDRRGVVALVELDAVRVELVVL